MARGQLTVVEPDQASSHYPIYETGRNVVEYGANRYVFYRAANAALCYRKSTDRGKSFSKTVIHVGSYQRIDVWFDRWTPGNSGTVVHIWGIDDTSDDVLYFSLDLATDTLGNGGVGVVVFAGATAALTSDNIELSGAKSRGGNLYCAFNIDDGTESGVYRSTDNGATWTARATIVEGLLLSDRWIIFPGNEADNQDMWLVFWDTSVNEISLKVYDDSADSWAETLISTSIVEISRVTAGPQIFGTVRLSDGHLLLAAWNSRDAATSDLQTWDINGAASITAKTNVITDADDCQTVILTLSPAEVVHCTYLGKSDGSETVSTALTVNRKVSQDGMATWGAEVAVFDDFLQAADAQIGTCHSEGEWPLAVWLNTAFVSGQDVRLGAYLPSRSPAQSAIGV